ncbi:MAG: lysine--tRNA ligase [Candidatus Dormibacteria bacterium]|jgi:lysyl-tRNA synthetase class 2
MPDDPLMAERRRKAEALAALGLPVYNVDFRPDHTLEEARRALVAWEQTGPAADAPGPPVTVAGRLMLHRIQGRSVFSHLEDEGGRLQVWLKQDQLGEPAFEAVRLLDLGDIVGVAGTLMRTRRGEPTVLVQTLTPLVKALRQPPEKFHGLQDQETRYRKRYYDLMSSAGQRRHFRHRAELLRSVRRTLEGRDFLEVETPILQLIPGGGHAVPFRTHWNALHTDVYLRIAIELHLKRLLVGGYRRVYEIGRVFRNEGLSPRHNPEFTMLEAYQAYADYGDMRELTEAIVVDAARAVPLGAEESGGGGVEESGGGGGAEAVEADPAGSPTDPDPLHRRYGGRDLDLTPPFRTQTMAALIEEVCGFDPVRAWDDGSLEARARQSGVELQPGQGPGTVFNEIYEQKVERTLFDPTFVLDYPAEVSPLARRSRSDPRFVERFELVVAGRELANAFSELNDPIDQRSRFEEQARQRDLGATETQPLDEDFLEAIEAGMPPAGGLGIGVDRLVMLLTDSPGIRDVLLFPTMRPTADAEVDA